MTKLKDFTLPERNDVKLILREYGIKDNLEKLTFIYKNLNPERLFIIDFFVDNNDVKENSLLIDDECNSLYGCYKSEDFNSLEEMMNETTNFFNEIKLTDNDNFGFLLNDVCSIIDEFLEKYNKPERTGTRLYIGDNLI